MVDLLLKILLSIFFGAFIGLEREYHKSKAGIGVRTNSFVCLFGTLATFFTITYNSPLFLFLGIALVGGLAISLFWFRMRTEKHPGLTTSVALILSFFIGAMVTLEFFREAIALSVIIFILLFTKRTLVGKIRHLTEEEILNAVEFAIIAFV